MAKNRSMKKFKVFTRRNLTSLPQIQNIPADLLRSILAVSSVLPFRVNNYVTDELIDWDNLPSDPIFQLTFPQSGMLRPQEFDSLVPHVDSQDPIALKDAARIIQERMNPHPAGQMDLNVPIENGEVFKGMQHKYRETVLFFPTQGQTCHAYCTYCFRWAQFVGANNLRFANDDPGALSRYISAHPEVTDALITGGDPLVMRTRAIEKYLRPLLDKRPGNLQTIRFGTKALAYWPYRFTTDSDADELMQLFESVVKNGYQLAIMAHFSHPRELETPAVKEAIRRLRAVGAVVRCQAPLIKHINDHADIWADMWQKQVALGAVPYYMFIERDTGPKEYFSVPLAEAYDIFTGAYRQVSGLCRTVRGPSMSANPGKVVIDGVTELHGEKVFVLKYIQGRDPEWVNQVFFAKYDPKACWLNDLKPAFGETDFFYENRFEEIKSIRQCRN